MGRLNELNEIARLLQETRLITLTGPGGIGNSRLALKSAERAMGDYKDGCFFISLAPIPGFEHIVQTIAESLKFPFASSDDPQVQLLRYLKSRELLLVLDNFEHLLEGAQIVSEILITAPDVKVLGRFKGKTKPAERDNNLDQGVRYYTTR